MLNWPIRILALVPLALSPASLSAQDQPNSPAQSILTADEAIDLLPPIGAEATWNESRKDLDFDPAVIWMRDHIASGGTLTGSQWQRALSKSRAIRIRERWPADTAFAVGMEVPAWLPVTEIRLDPELDALTNISGGGTVSIWCGNCSDGASRRARYQELGKLELGARELVFKTVVERGRPPTGPYARRQDAPPPEGPAAGVLWTGTLAFQVEVVPTLEGALPAQHGDELDAGVRKLLDACLFHGTELVVHADFERAPELSTTAVSLELALFDGDIQLETKTLLALPRPGLIYQAVGWDLPAPPEDASRWSVRVRGRPTDVLQNWDATRYWDGELTIPLADVQRR